MNRPRPFFQTILGVVIAAGCANEATGPSTRPLASVSLDASTLLSCDATPSAIVSVKVGNSGGTVRVGGHTLSIPKGAIQGQPVTIVAATGGLLGNTIQFGPEGLQFQKPATLTFSAANCTGWGQIKQYLIAYIDSAQDVLELRAATTVSSSNKTVSGLIYHFSQYAVAY